MIGKKNASKKAFWICSAVATPPGFLLSIIQAQVIKIVTKMPSLVLKLTISMHMDNPEESEMVGFLLGILLGSELHVRSWFSFFTRNAQKKKVESLSQYRQILLEKLQDLVTTIHRRDRKSNGACVEAASVLRLYTALRGLAGMK